MIARDSEGVMLRGVGNMVRLMVMMMAMAMVMLVVVVMTMMMAMVMVVILYVTFCHHDRHQGGRRG
jgi:hypothetical protein